MVRPGTRLPGTRLIFDGDCAFCTITLRVLGETLPFLPDATPWQWVDLDEFALTRDDVTHSAWLVTPKRQFAGHHAFAALLRMQPTAGWRFLGHLFVLPPWSWIGELGYRLIARYRHRLPGGTAACAMPRTPQA